MRVSNEEIERVLLVGINQNKLDDDFEDSMDELSELAIAAGAEVVSRMSQPRVSPDPSTYIGKGKAREVDSVSKELRVDTVIFNDELSGSQLRNLSKIIDAKIVDRTNLILDIFAQRATSLEGKYQIKLAQLQYRLPRLAGSGKYMSRTGGGIGTRGPGEQQLETDRRHIQREISNIKRELETVRKNRQTLRSRRMNTGMPIVALAGYTNSGKSTLLNRLIQTTGDDKDREVFVKDMLFATLGTNLRRAEFNSGEEFLIIDTVGFVSRLPTHLVEAFKSTLEEIEYADLIVHVVDSANVDANMQIETTQEILKDLDVMNKPMVYAFNKVDLLEHEKTSLTNEHKPSLFISAKDGTNIDKLLDMIHENLPTRYYDVKMLFDFNQQSSMDYFANKYNVSDIEYTEKGSVINLRIDERDFKKYREYVIYDDI